MEFFIPSYLVSTNLSLFVIELDYRLEIYHIHRG